MKWLFGGLILFAALPSTSNYQLQGFGFGSGGTANSSTANYSLEGSSGDLYSQTGQTANYVLKPGFIQAQQANVPKIAALDNGSGVYYNKLHFVIDQQNNPSDALYALSISTDNFGSDIRYVKNDLTVGSSLNITDYKTYAAWGGASGSNIIGLLPNTTYYLKAKATQGKFTESGYGPSQNAATVNPYLTFSVSTSNLAIGNLYAATVVDAPQTINLSLGTNASSGAVVYIGSLNNGLKSLLSGTTITSSTGDLTALSRGYGAQVTATSATTGSIGSSSPYNSSANNVGIVDSFLRQIMLAPGPVTGGTGSILMKAKSATTDPIAADYTDTLTTVATASF